MSRARLMDAVPPPPAGPSLARRQLVAEAVESADKAPKVVEETHQGGGHVFPFDAELELADDPGSTVPLQRYIMMQSAGPPLSSEQP